VEFSRRMDRLPPYLFAEIERKIAAKREQGVDVISLGIGDPDLPTPDFVIAEMKHQLDDPRNHRYPSNAGVPEFGQGAAHFYRERFGVEIDPGNEFFPLLGSKEGLAHVCWAVLDPGDLALVPDPGYPVYAGSSILAGADVHLMPLLAENDFLPDLDAIPEDVARKAKLMFISYPNNPTAAVADLGFFREVVDFAKTYDIAVVHDNAYSELTFDGYVAPSFLEVEGAKEVGVEFFSLSKPWNMTGWRIGFAVGNPQILEALWRLKTNLDSGMFEALQRTAATVLSGDLKFVDAMRAVYERRRDQLVKAFRDIGMAVEPPKGTIYLWLPVPDGYTSTSFAEHVLDQAGVVLTPGNGYGEAGEGFVRVSLTVPDDRIHEAVERIERSLKL